MVLGSSSVPDPQQVHIDGIFFNFYTPPAQASVAAGFGILGLGHLGLVFRVLGFWAQNEVFKLSGISASGPRI